MIAQLAVPALMAWTGWVWLAPFTTAWLVAQLPLVVIVVGKLLGEPPAPARLRLVVAQCARRPPAGVIVVRPADVPTLAAWRARGLAERSAA